MILLPFMIPLAAYISQYSIRSMGREPPSYWRLLLITFLTFIGASILALFSGMVPSNTSIGQIVIWAWICGSWFIVHGLMLSLTFKYDDQPSYRFNFVVSLNSLPPYLVVLVLSIIAPGT